MNNPQISIPQEIYKPDQVISSDWEYSGLSCPKCDSIDTWTRSIEDDFGNNSEFICDGCNYKINEE
jgi:hypothetical protein